MVKTVSFWSLLQTLSHRFWCSIKGEKGPLLCSPLYLRWQHHNKIFCTLVILAGILSANSLVNLGQLPVLQAKACLYKIMANYMHVSSVNHRVFFPWFIQCLLKKKTTKKPKNPNQTQAISQSDSPWVQRVRAHLQVSALIFQACLSITQGKAG